MGMEKWQEKARQLREQQEAERTRRQTIVATAAARLDSFDLSAECKAAKQLLGAAQRCLALRTKNFSMELSKFRFHNGFEKWAPRSCGWHDLGPSWGPMHTQDLVDKLIENYMRTGNTFPSQEQAIALCDELLNTLRADLDKLASE